MARRVQSLDEKRTLLRSYQIIGVGYWHTMLHFKGMWVCRGAGPIIVVAHLAARGVHLTHGH